MTPPQTAILAIAKQAWHFARENEVIRIRTAAIGMIYSVERYDGSRHIP